MVPNPLFFALCYVYVFCLSVKSADLLEFNSELATPVSLGGGPVEFDAWVVVHVAFGYGLQEKGGVGAAAEFHVLAIAVFCRLCAAVYLGRYVSGLVVLPAPVLQNFSEAPTGGFRAIG
jgi:hypothetical protein